MTWYIKPKEIAYPNAKVMKDTSYTFVMLPDGSKVAPGTYKVKKGATITVQGTIRNEGGEGYCRVEIWDRKNNVLIAAVEKSLPKGYALSVSKSVTVDREMEIIVKAKSMVNGSWQETDSWG